MKPSYRTIHRILKDIEAIVNHKRPKEQLRKRIMTLTNRELEKTLNICVNEMWGKIFY